MAPHAKRRKITTTAVEELNFDPDARKEFLTGFHKRKLQRAKNAQEAAERRAKEERRETRKKLRDDRNAEIQKVLEENKAMIESMKDSSDEEGSGGSEDENEGEWQGFAEPPPAVDYEAEYIDEDKYTTVTVEDLDPSKEEDEEEEDWGESNGEKKEQNTEPSIPRTNSKAKGKPDKSKSKKKKFRYENKAERKFSQIKSRAVKSSKAKARRER